MPKTARCSWQVAGFTNEHRMPEPPTGPWRLCWGCRAMNYETGDTRPITSDGLYVKGPDEQNYGYEPVTGHVIEKRDYKIEARPMI